MPLKYYLIVLFIISSFVSFSQSDDTIFSVNGNPVSVQEFLSVYNKNLHIVVDDDQKGIENYLSLYINYKLKIAQARDLGLDTLKSYKNELQTYKKQLMEPYLKDDTFISKLVKEAYERSLIEVNAHHILVSLPEEVKDTMPAFAKISEARIKILNGEPFDIVAKQYSDDGSVNGNGGDLGYFSVFDMVYQFENAAYGLKSGEVSEIFKTRFGYHIVKVDAIREARGEVEAAHIMIKDEHIEGEKIINTLYDKVVNGDSTFETIAKQYSDDIYSGKKGGSLGRFGSGKMVKEFEDVCFELEEGVISKPFKTEFGWHIIKLIKKYPVERFEVQEKRLIDKVRRGDRASLVSNSIVHKIKDNYKLSVIESALNPFKNGTWRSQKLNNELMRLEELSISQSDFELFLKDEEYSETKFEKFKNYQILEYYKAHLEETNQEFANMYQEYKEGLLLFELLQRKVWDKSNNPDELKKYFEANKLNYNSESLEDIKGKVSNDFQKYLEDSWIEELHETYDVIMNEKVVLKLIENTK